MILNFFGNTLYLPPIVSSPKGNPKIRRMLNIITINIKIAPMIAAIYVPSIFLSSKLHIKHLLNICQLFKSHLPLFTNSWIFIFKGCFVCFKAKNSASFFTETVPSPAGCSFPNRSFHISGYRRFQRTFDAFQQTYFQFHIDFFPFHRITPITPVKRIPAIGMSATDSISEPSSKKHCVQAYCLGNERPSSPSQ